MVISRAGQFRLLNSWTVYRLDRFFALLFPFRLIAQNSRLIVSVLPFKRNETIKRLFWAIKRNETECK